MNSKNRNADLFKSLKRKGNYARTGGALREITLSED